MKLNADLTGVKDYTNLPKNLYLMRIEKVTPGVSKKNATNKLLEIVQKPVAQDFADNQITTWPVYSGIYATGANAGKPMIPYDLAKIIEGYQIPWECGHCHVNGARDFLKGTRDNGLTPGGYFCPECRNTIRLEFDTTDFIGKMAICSIDIEVDKDNPEKEYNRIKAYLRADASIPEGVTVVK